MTEVPPNLVRQFVDGQLEGDDRRRVEDAAASDPQVAAQVRFERILRDRVGQAMTSATPATPVDLEARVRTALRRAEDEDMSEPIRGGWLVGPTRANVFAVAASLALVAGAILFGIFGPQMGRMTPVGPGAGITEIARYASDEHRRCAGHPDSRDAKATWASTPEATERLRDSLGRPVPVPDLSELGFRFVGAGEGGVPGYGGSGHLIYARSGRGEDGCPEAMLSLFAVPDTGQFAGDPTLDIPRWEWTKVGERPECKKIVACASDGEVFYFLVCCDERSLARLAAEISSRGRAGAGSQTPPGR